MSCKIEVKVPEVVQNAGDKVQEVATSAVCETLKGAGWLAGWVKVVASATYEEVAKGYEGVVGIK